MVEHSVSAVLCLLILSVAYRPIRAQNPGMLYCGLFCYDYDVDAASSTTSLEDLIDLVFGDVCDGCPTRAPPTTTTMNPMQQMPFNFMFPNNNQPMNMTMGRTGNGWFFNFWPFSGATPAPPGAIPAAAPSAPAPGPAPTPSPSGGRNATNTTAAG